MLNPNAQKWVDALRSGRFVQGRDALTNITPDGLTHCCLGVACQVAIENGVVLRQEDVTTEHDNYVVYNGYSGSILPPVVVDWLGINSSEAGALVLLNDRRYFDFKQIADYIEEREDVLFTPHDA